MIERACLHKQGRNPACGRQAPAAGRLEPVLAAAWVVFFSMCLEVICYIREKLIGSLKILLKELLRYVKVMSCQRHPDGPKWVRYTGAKLSNDRILK